MERLTWISWRAFWVGLGAATVIIGQAIFAPAASGTPANAESAAHEVAPQAATSPREAVPAYGTRYARAGES